MDTTAQKTISVPEFLYGTIVGPFSMSTEFITDIVVGKSYERANQSVPRSYIDALYRLGRDIELGIVDPKLLKGVPEEAQELGKFVYRRMQEKRGEGAFHNDYVLFEPEVKKIPKLERPGDGYTAGLFFHDATGFERDGGFDIKNCKLSKRLWFPQGNGRFIVPGKNSINNYFGLPDATENNEKRAIEMLAARLGITVDQARNEASRFYRANDGWALVESWSDGDDGPSCVDLDYRPLDRNDDTGRFAASRSPSGARPASE